MTKVVMTRYHIVENRLVFPECPFAGEDSEYSSKEVICSKPTAKYHYCSDMNEKGVCPFDEQQRTKGGEHR
jgi:hypothetical protein